LDAGLVQSKAAPSQMFEACLLAAVMLSQWVAYFLSGSFDYKETYLGSL
jgi:hypothetical protein